MYFLFLYLIKRQFLNPWIHALCSLAHKSTIKVPRAGLCLFLPLPLSSSQRGHSFRSNSYCPFLPPMYPTWSSGRSGMAAPAKAVMCRHTHTCAVSSMCSLYTWLQLFLGNCTRWFLRGLNQRIAALHSSSDTCMLFLPSPGLSWIAKLGAFPED